MSTLSSRLLFDQTLGLAAGSKQPDLFQWLKVFDYSPRRLSRPFPLKQYEKGQVRAWMRAARRGYLDFFLKTMKHTLTYKRGLRFFGNRIFGSLRRVPQRMVVVQSDEGHVDGFEVILLQYVDLFEGL